MELQLQLLRVCKKFEPEGKEVMYSELKQGKDGINKN
jgi:hypothetical protein